VQDFDEVWELLVEDASVRALALLNAIVVRLLRKRSGYQVRARELAQSSRGCNQPI
jgi:hypothetical protein